MVRVYQVLDGGIQLIDADVAAVCERQLVCGR